MLMSRVRVAAKEFQGDYRFSRSRGYPVQHGRAGGGVYAAVGTICAPIRMTCLPNCAVKDVAACLKKRISVIQKRLASTITQIGNSGFSMKMTNIV